MADENKPTKVELEGLIGDVDLEINETIDRLMELRKERVGYEEALARI